ncbi:MAG TPA: hypothetical protein VLG27_00705 [Candidatus Saccharimonadia bacterium]|nr:hypothetical protein [Candidatus Saccharimonadia bacterium]
MPRGNGQPPYKQPEEAGQADSPTSDEIAASRITAFLQTKRFRSQIFEITDPEAKSVTYDAFVVRWPDVWERLRDRNKKDSRQWKHERQKIRSKRGPEAVGGDFVPSSDLTTDDLITLAAEKGSYMTQQKTRRAALLAALQPYIKYKES